MLTFTINTSGAKSREIEGKTIRPPYCKMGNQLTKTPKKLHTKVVQCNTWELTYKVTWCLVSYKQGI
jgi:hypothetical protein